MFVLELPFGHVGKADGSKTNGSFETEGLALRGTPMPAV